MIVIDGLVKKFGNRTVVDPSAAESIREGLEETLTLHRLGIPGL
ncbi:hypothetical protein [Sporomusa acidovorans]|nr:hypothetical protein [Sporomusa acidovorans]